MKNHCSFFHWLFAFFTFCFSGDVFSAQTTQPCKTLSNPLSLLFSINIQAENETPFMYYLSSDTSKPNSKVKRLWKDYLNDTNWEDSDHEHNEEQDHCHKKFNLKHLSVQSIQNNIPIPITINKQLPWMIQKLPLNWLVRSNFPRSQKQIDSLLKVDSIKRQIRFLSRIPAKTNFYFQSAHPLNSRQWLLQSQNFVGFRAQYGITNSLSTGVCRDFSGYWMQGNIQLNAIRYKGYAATLGMHGGKYFPLDSRVWGGSLNQTFSTKCSETSIRISTNQLYDIKDARKENLTINFAHKQRLNKTWTLIGEIAYLPGEDRKKLIFSNEWLNAEQLNQKRAMDQYTWLVGMSKVMGKKTHFDFGIQAISSLGEIYTIKQMPYRQFVDRWTFILPFPFINMSIVL